MESQKARAGNSQLGLSILTLILLVVQLGSFVEAHSSQFMSAHVGSSRPACNSSSTGELWYSASAKFLQVCDGNRWQCTQKENCRLSTVEPGPELSTGYTSSFVTFTVVGKRKRSVQYMLLTQNSGDLTQADHGNGGGDADVRAARLYKMGHNQVPTLRQTILLGQVKTAKTFTTGGKLYLAVLSSQGRDANSVSLSGSITVFVWTGKRFRRTPHQEVSTLRRGVASIDTFQIHGESYLVLVGASTGGQYGTWITLYKWSTHEAAAGKFHLAFDHDYTEPMTGRPAERLILADASHVRHYSLSGYHFLSVSTVFDGKSTKTDSYLFQVYITCRDLLGCVSLQQRQAIATDGAISSEFVTYRSDVYLMFANSFSGRAPQKGALRPPGLDNFRITSSLHRLNFRNQLFEPFQEVTTVAADSIKFFTVCRDLYFAVTSRLPNATLVGTTTTDSGAPTMRTAIFRWRGIEKFQPWLELPLRHRTWGLDVVRSAGTQYLAESFVDERGVPASRLLELRTNGGECHTEDV